MTPSPAATITHRLGDEVVEIRCSTKADGDFHLTSAADGLDGRRQAFVPGAWTQLDEVHGTEVVVVERPGAGHGATADAAVTWARDAVLGIWVGDCAPVVMAAAGGAVAAVHAGWRGTLAGVLERTLDTMAATDVAATDVDAWLGPCIHPCCYEFGDADLASVAAAYGPHAVGVTRWGAPALDVPGLVRCALERRGVRVHDVSACTGCHPDLWFSHRARGEAGRHVMAVWKRAGA